jgi:hypothetical protein
MSRSLQHAAVATLLAPSIVCSPVTHAPNGSVKADV